MLSTEIFISADYCHYLPMRRTIEGGALVVGAIVCMIIRWQLQCLQIPIRHPLLSHISRYDFFLRTFGTGFTFSCL